MDRNSLMERVKNLKSLLKDMRACSVGKLRVTNKLRDELVELKCELDGLLEVMVPMHGEDKVNFPENQQVRRNSEVGSSFSDAVEAYEAEYSRLLLQYCSLGTDKVQFPETPMLLSDIRALISELQTSDTGPDLSDAVEDHEADDMLQLSDANQLPIEQATPTVHFSGSMVSSPNATGLSDRYPSIGTLTTQSLMPSTQFQSSSTCTSGDDCSTSEVEVEKLPQHVAGLQQKQLVQRGTELPNVAVQNKMESYKHDPSEFPKLGDSLKLKFDKKTGQFYDKTKGRSSLPSSSDQ